MSATSDGTPWREPIVSTLTRNVAIAVVIGSALAFARRDPAIVLPNAALALWFSLGGHYVEIAFLELMRPRLASTGPARRTARGTVWFIGGALLYVLMAVTARVLPVPQLRLGWWWIGGLAFGGMELVVHAGLALRGRPNFYRGDG